MSETKRHLISRLSSESMGMVLAHGTYEVDQEFVVPPGLVIIFVCRAARYLPQYIINEKFYRLFTSKTRLRAFLAGRMIRYRHPRTPGAYVSTVPYLEVMKDWQKRTYGPGDTCPDITLVMSDPSWGMGVHEVPLQNGELSSRHGLFAGETLHLSQLVRRTRRSGILFVTSCRATRGMPTSYHNVSKTYSFPTWSLEHKLQQKNVSSSRVVKRKRDENRKTPQSSSKRRKTVTPVPLTKRQLLILKKIKLKKLIAKRKTK